MKTLDLHYKEEYRLYTLTLILGLFFCYTALPVEKQPTFLFYTGTLLLSMICIYISEVLEKKTYRFLFFWTGIFILAIPMAFRLPIAVDDDNYIRMFNRAQYSFRGYLRTSPQEKGYLALNWIIYRITEGNYNHFVVIITYLTFILWGIAFRQSGKRNGSGMYMALFLWSHFYFFVLNSGLIRLFMAIPMVMIGIQYIWKDKWKIFVFWVVLASFIHLSSLIMLLFLVFYYKRKIFYEHWIVFVFITMFLVLIGLVLTAQFIVPMLGERYENYGEINDLSFSTGSFTTLPIWIACFYYYSSLSNVSALYRKRYIIGMILLSLSIIFPIASSMVHVGRIIFFAYLGLLIVVSSIFQIKTRNALDLFLKCLLVIYPLVYVMATNFLNSYKTQLFPYQTFLWENY